jgi:hypothetical protein
MKSIVSILEQELEGAVDIKDKDFLHRYGRFYLLLL